MVVKIHDDSSSRKVLDSKPQVRNVDGYCAKVGPGGRSSATGRWGPTWCWNGQPCTDATFANCATHQDNQFLAIGIGSSLSVPTVRECRGRARW
jgi:hypothetical protein